MVLKGQPNPNAGRKAGGTNFKSLIRIEKAVRLELMGLTDAQIAAHIRCGPAGLANLKRRAEYQLLKTELATGVISDYHSALKEDTDYIRSKLRAAVPKALETLVEAAQMRGSSQHLRIAVEASKSILDRDGRLAPVSRIGLPTEDQGGVASKQDQDLAIALAKALAEQKQKEVDTTQPTINSTPATSQVQ